MLSLEFSEESERKDSKVNKWTDNYLYQTKFQMGHGFVVHKQKR